ncbi:hypothetical protein FF86_10704 [Frankia sp. CpI1-P]|nr:hypothetical protein FF86_10704 [Frankia sp. CpI1-P]
MNTAFAAMTKMRLKEPEVVETENSVIVLIRHDKLDSPGTIVLNYLKENGTINNRQGREIAGIPRDVEMRRIFQRLIQKELIERVPGTVTAGAKYRLKGSNVV